jgi:hypothetical protein
VRVGAREAFSVRLVGAFVVLEGETRAARHPQHPQHPEHPPTDPFLYAVPAPRLQWVCAREAQVTCRVRDTGLLRFVTDSNADAAALAAALREAAARAPAWGARSTAPSDTAVLAPGAPSVAFFEPAPARLTVVGAAPDAQGVVVSDVALGAEPVAKVRASASGAVAVDVAGVAEAVVAELGTWERARDFALWVVRVEAGL